MLWVPARIPGSGVGVGAGVDEWGGDGDWADEGIRTCGSTYPSPRATRIFVLLIASPNPQWLRVCLHA